MLPAFANRFQGFWSACPRCSFSDGVERLIDATVDHGMSSGAFLPTTCMRIVVPYGRLASIRRSPAARLSLLGLDERNPRHPLGCPTSPSNGVRRPDCHVSTACPNPRLSTSPLQIKPSVQLHLVPRTETRHGFGQRFVEFSGVLALEEFNEPCFVLDDAAQVHHAGWPVQVSIGERQHGAHVDFIGFAPLVR